MAMIIMPDLLAVVLTNFLIMTLILVLQELSWLLVSSLVCRKSDLHFSWRKSLYVVYHNHDRVKSCRQQTRFSISSNCYYKWTRLKSNTGYWRPLECVPIESMSAAVEHQRASEEQSRDVGPFDDRNSTVTSTTCYRNAL